MCVSVSVCVCVRVRVRVCVCGSRFRCRAIDNTVCTVYKPLRLWRVPTRIADQTRVCVCVCVRPTVSLIILSN